MVSNAIQCHLVRFYLLCNTLSHGIKVISKAGNEAIKTYDFLWRQYNVKSYNEYTSNRSKSLNIYTPLHYKNSSYAIDRSIFSYHTVEE